jgi:6-phosphogluconolactonase
MTSHPDGAFRLSRRRALAAIGLSAAAAAVPSLALAAPGDATSPTPVTSYVYVNLNTSGANTVAGYSRRSDGTLSPLAGSPFSVGGAGTGVGLGSQGAIQLAHAGRHLLVADAGSNQISVLRVARDGSLTPVSGSPFDSGGISPVTIAVVPGRGMVFVGNQGNGGSNYTGFMFGASGALTPIPGSTYAVPDGAGVGEVVVDPTGRHLAGARVVTSLIDSLVIAPNGGLTAGPNSPYAAPIAGPLGSAFRASATPQLYVSLAHGGALAGAVGAFTVAADGTISPIGASPFPDSQTAACWVAISPDQKYLFTANAGSDSISSYAINPGGTLTLASTTVLRGTGIGTFDLRFNPSGSNLYVVEGNAHAIGILSVSGGTMTEIDASPVALPEGGAPFGIAIT